MAAKRGGTTEPAHVSDGPVFLSKANEFLAAAELSIELEHFSAAASNSVHATIAAADAVASARLPTRWKGDHAGAAAHVAPAGDEGKICAKSLNKVVPLKTRAEYDPTPTAPAKATGAIRAARQAVEAATRVVAQ